MKRVLVLGAGLVVKPLLDDLYALHDVELHLAALNIDRANRLLAGRERAKALEINAFDHARLDPEVAGADVVISLLPADQHVHIAEACLEHRVPLITTSYVSDQMRALDQRARERGVLLLNETGLDPGIDHLTAAEVIRRVQREGGQIISFASHCGALPAPESNTNPWGYKFAWSPRGVVMAARNPVRYIEEGKIIERHFPDFFDAPRLLDIPGVGKLEAYPNRDCLRYLKPYGLSDVRDFFRGTLRYPGWSATWHALFELGLLSVEAQDWTGMTYAEFLSHHLPSGSEGLVSRLARRLGLSEEDDSIARLEWLGLLSDRPVAETIASPLDVLTNRLERKLRYAPGERDMVVLEHHLVVRSADEKLCRITTRLLLSGEAGDDSALARTVSIPAALACRLILDNQVDLSGVQIPVDPQLTGPILLGLERHAIHVKESEQNLSL